MSSNWKEIVRGLPDFDQGGLTLGGKAQAIATLNSMPPCRRKPIVDSLLDDDTSQSERVELLKAVLGLNGSFHSPAEWDFFLCSGVFELRVPDVEGVGQRLWDAGYIHPKEVADTNCAELAGIIGQPESTVSRIHDICQQYSRMFTRHEVLSKVPRPVAMSTVASRSKQSDKDKKAHPASVELWDSCEAEVCGFVESLPSTPYTFPAASSSSSKGGAGEASCEAAFMRAACEGVNRLLRYEEAKENTLGHQWQQQSRRTATDSQLKEQEVPRDQAVKQAVGQASRSVHDLALKSTTDGRRTVSVVEMKRTERSAVLIEKGCEIKHGGMEEGPKSRIPYGVGDEGMEVAAPDIVAIWNKKAINVPAPLQQNVVGVLSQLLRYCASQGITYAMFSCWWFTWAVQLKDNALKVSRAFAWDSMKPTLLGLTHFISHKAISASTEGMTPWPPLQQYPFAQPSGATSREAPPQGDSTARAPSASGLDGGHAAGSHGQEDMPGTSAGAGKRKRLQEDQEQQGSGSMCSALAAQAASIDLQQVEGVVGSGSIGDVFSIRLGGGLAALKVAPVDSWEAASLSNEGEVLTRLEPLWDRVVPGLLACGPDADDVAYFLATRLVSACRHLDPARDAPLLPQLQDALRAVHEMGVVHGDLRRENILVEEGKGGEAPRVWLVDFGLASLVGTLEQQEEEVRGLRGLVGAY